MNKCTSVLKEEAKILSKSMNNGWMYDEFFFVNEFYVLFITHFTSKDTPTYVCFNNHARNCYYAAGFTPHAYITCTAPDTLSIINLPSLPVVIPECLLGAWFFFYCTYFFNLLTVHFLKPGLLLTTYYSMSSSVVFAHFEQWFECCRCPFALQTFLYASLFLLPRSPCLSSLFGVK